MEGRVGLQIFLYHKKRNQEILASLFQKRIKLEVCSETHSTTNRIRR